MHKMHKEILDRFHSYTDLAHHIGVSPKTVWNWTKKGIPPKRFKDVVRAARICHVKGVTSDMLYKMMNEDN